METVKPKPVFTVSESVEDQLTGLTLDLSEEAQLEEIMDDWD
ncbi:hypothetical protein [Gimesia maris]|nr:hypothetical protein [Gimesia maris]